MKACNAQLTVFRSIRQNPIRHQVKICPLLSALRSARWFLARDSDNRVRGTGHPSPFQAAGNGARGYSASSCLYRANDTRPIVSTRARKRHPGDVLYRAKDPLPGCFLFRRKLVTGAFSCVWGLWSCDDFCVSFCCGEFNMRVGDGQVFQLTEERCKQRSGYCQVANRLT